jgi:hypothetical protein
MDRSDTTNAVAIELRRLKPVQWTRTEAERVLELWRASGRPLQTFARKHDLVPQRLRRWRDLLGVPRPQSPLGLVPAVIVGTPGAGRDAGAGSPAVVVRVPGGGAVEVVAPERVAPAWVAALVVALETSA